MELEIWNKIFIRKYVKKYCDEEEKPKTVIVLIQKKQKHGWKLDLLGIGCWSGAVTPWLTLVYV